MTNLTTILTADNLFDALHNHFPEGLVLILEVPEYFIDNFDDANLPGNFDCGLDELFIVPLLDGHPPNPEAVEVLVKQVLTDVVGIYTITGDYLFEHLQDDLPQLLLVGPELVHDGRQHTFCILRSVFGVHQGNDIAHCFQVGSQCLVLGVRGQLPQWNKYIIEGLDSIGC